MADGSPKFPEIVYVDGAVNHYKYDTGVIVLDEQLKDYPLAHDLILNHEWKHAEKDGFLEILHLELSTDLRRLFDDSEEIRQVKEYYDDAENRKVSRRFAIKMETVNLLRGLWMVVLGPLGGLYRWVGGLMA